MEGFFKKITAVILAAVLSFVLLVPVPIGNVAIDRGRFSQAHATVAIPAGWAIWGTAAALAGLYICATSDTDYVSAVQQAYSDFLDAVGSDEATFTPMMLEYYNANDGTINFYEMYSDLFGDDFVNYAQGLVEDGSAIVSENSNLGAYSATIGDVTFSIGSEYPSTWYQVSEHAREQRQGAINGKTYIGYSWFPDGQHVYMFFVNPSALPLTVTQVNSDNVNGYSGKALRAQNSNITELLLAYNTSTNNWYIPNVSSVLYVPSGHAVLTDAAVVKMSNQTPTIGNFPVGINAAISGALAAGLVNIPAGTYGVYQPTTAELQAGYDAAAVLQAISSAGGAISDDLTGLAGIMTNTLGQVTGLADSVSSLAGMVAQLVASNAALQSWAGSDSFGNVMNTVLDGLGDIAGGIEAGVDDLIGALADIPGADVLSPSIDAILDAINDITAPIAVDIPGAIEGVLEGVRDIPGTIEVGVVDVVDAINAMTLDIAGAIESVMSPFMQTFQVPSGDGTPVAVPMGITDSLALAFEDKVPFCYVIRSSRALQSMFANFSQSRSFYFDVTLPFSDETVTFDGEIFLSQPFGVSDIATTIKVILTALICFGLLWRSYKIIERAVL